MSFKRLILSGLGIWAITFIVSVVAYPLREHYRALFESIMPVVLALATAWMATRNFRDITKNPAAFGWQAGLFWLALNVLLDQFFFNWGPMKMSTADYVMDIALTYLIIPAITVSIGITLKRKADVSIPVAALPPDTTSQDPL